MFLFLKEGWIWNEMHWAFGPDILIETKNFSLVYLWIENTFFLRELKWLKIVNLVLMQIYVPL